MRNLLETLAGLVIFTLSICVSSSQADEGDATIVHVGLVTPNTLFLTISEGTVTLGELVQYEPKPGDAIDDQRNRRTIVSRNGQAIGHLTGSEFSKTRYLRTLDSYRGKRADRTMLTDAGSWKVRVGDKTLKITDAYRKSRVTNVADAIEGRPDVCFEHTIYLRADATIAAGMLSVESADKVLAAYEQPLSPLMTRSEAIHVSTIGFRPNDPLKLAVLSCWMGDGGPVDYRELATADGNLPRFAVVDDKTGKPVAQGVVELLRQPDQPADHKGLQGRPDGTTANYAGTPTFQIDFSSLEQAGTYRVTVQGIGTSFPFRINEDVYRPILDIALDGLDAHRWGEHRAVKLIDGTVLDRPAAVPTQHESFENVPVFETSAIYTNANFEDFEPGRIGPWQPGSPELTVVGGYMDAGDFDRNHNHWVVGYWLLDLAARKTDSDPALAQRLVEAALWDVEFWAKLQRPDGSVPSAVEYAEHPRSSEPSWLNSLPVYVCAPSREANIDFATSSAKAAWFLKQTGRSADAQRLSAASAKAFAWADSQPSPIGTDPKMEADAMLLAVTELWNATQEDVWRGRALELIDERVPEAWSAVFPDGLLALLTILEMPVEKSQLTDRQRERIEGSVKRTIEMNYLEGSSRRSPFRALKNGWVGISFGNGAWPTVDSLSVLRAWYLFKDPEYHAAAVAGLAYSLGGNPNNMVYMTGVNSRSVRNVLHCDTRSCGRAAPIGIPIYGPGLSTDMGNAWPVKWHLAADQTIYPTYSQWPSYENVHQYWNWGMLMEYTVHQSHVSAIYLAGMLDELDP